MLERWRGDEVVAGRMVVRARLPDNESATWRTTVPCYRWPTLACRHDNESVAGRTTVLTRWHGNKRAAGQMTVPRLCGPSPTCWLSWQRGGGQCSLVVATQVGGWADDAALVSLSVPCSNVQQRRLIRVDDGSSALWAIFNWWAELAAGRRTMLARCCDAQVGGWVYDGALASLSNPCSLVRQQW